MEAFRPALAITDAEFRRLRYELTTLAAWTARIVTVAVVVLFLSNAALVPSAIARIIA